MLSRVVGCKVWMKVGGCALRKMEEEQTEVGWEKTGQVCDDAAGVTQDELSVKGTEEWSTGKVESATGRKLRCELISHSSGRTAFLNDSPLGV